MTDSYFNTLPLSFFGTSSEGIPTPAPVVGGFKQGATNQGPQGGSHYPFVTDPFSFRNLLSDFWLAYKDKNSEFQRPFSISWIGGAGPNDPASQPAGGEVYRGRFDLRVVDRNLKVVVNTTEPEWFFKSQRWGNKYITYTWDKPDMVVRATRLLSAEPPEFFTNSMTSNLRLDERTICRLAERVDSVGINGQKITQGAVEIAEGFNSKIEVTEPENPSLFKRVEIDLVPGEGRGRVPGCDDLPTLIRRINGLGPDRFGNVNLSYEGCGSVINSAIPNTAAPPRGALPSAAFVYAPHTITLSDECEPCYECGDFNRVAAGINRLHRQYAAIGGRAESARDQLGLFRGQWQEIVACKKNDPVFLQTRSEGLCRVTIAMAFCNNTGCCLKNVTYRITTRLFRDGETEYDTEPDIVPVCNQVVQSTDENPSTETETSLLGSYPAYYVTFDEIPAGRTAYVRAALKMPGCSAGDSVDVSGTVHIPVSDNDREDCEYPRAEQVQVPAEVSSLWPTDEDRYSVRYYKNVITDIDPANPCECIEL